MVWPVQTQAGGRTAASGVQVVAGLYGGGELIPEAFHREDFRQRRMPRSNAPSAPKASSLGSGTAVALMAY